MLQLFTTPAGERARPARDPGGPATVLGLAIVVIGATVAGAFVARWASSALELRLSEQVISIVAPRQPERAVVGAQPSPPQAPYCEPGQRPSTLLFSGLREAMGDAFGQPLECPHVDLSSGDTVQRTSTGLAIYRAASKTPTFTDGYHRWAIDSRGVITWEGDALDPPA